MLSQAGMMKAGGVVNRKEKEARPGVITHYPITNFLGKIRVGVFSKNLKFHRKIKARYLK